MKKLCFHLCSVHFSFSKFQLGGGEEEEQEEDLDNTFYPNKWIMIMILILNGCLTTVETLDKSYSGACHCHRERERDEDPSRGLTGVQMECYHMDSPSCPVIDK
ncbi:hypothetical protein RUM43_003608 [Polyplax serrata]|uniref:Uncharacterized protein n=1 Tax=Polyplax serrata TaxID=468196 RepID=A0AAN8NX15_POLSC